jgi:hypothetical protein
MIAFVVRLGSLGFVLYGALCGAAFLIGQNNQHQPTLHRLLSPTSECPAVCWEGIRPGMTTSDEATTRLDSLPFVTDVYAVQGVVTNGSFVRWNWTEPTPDYIDASRTGILWTHNGIVYYIEIPLSSRLGDVWRILGKPELNVVSYNPLIAATVQIEASYNNRTLNMQGTTKCPLSMWNLVDAPISLRFASAEAAAVYKVYFPLEMACR